MKPWIVAVVVGAVVLLVGVPTLAVAMAKGDASGTASTRSAVPRMTHDDRPGHGQGHAFGHHRGGPPPWAGGLGHGQGHGQGHGLGLGRLQKLTPQQRRDLADRLDTRAVQLQKLAGCLRSDKDVSACRSLSRPRPRG